MASPESKESHIHPFLYVSIGLVAVGLVVGIGLLIYYGPSIEMHLLLQNGLTATSFSVRATETAIHVWNGAIATANAAGTQLPEFIIPFATSTPTP